MKRIILLMTISLFAISSFAQEVQQQRKHEFSIWGAYGLSTFNYDLSYGDQTLGLGYLGGLGYNYFFNYHWSFGLGAEFSALTSSSDLSKLKDNYPIQGFLSRVNGTNQFKPLNVELETGNDYKQDYQGYYINIPVMLKYQVDAWSRNKFYVAGGAKIGIPFDGKFSSKGEYNVKAFERTATGENTGSAYTMKEYGFGQQKANVSDEKFDLDLNVSLAFETGIKWRLGRSAALYTGLFVDYGLLDVRKGDKNLDLNGYNIDNTTQKFKSYTVNNPLLAQYTKEVGGETKAFTDKVSTLSAGLKLQLAFGFGSFRNRSQAAGAQVIEFPKTLTAEEVSDIVARNTQQLIKAQKDDVQDIKDFLKNFFKKEKEEVAQGVRLQTVWGFELAKSTVVTPMLSTLDENLETLKNHPEIKVDLVGNTDDRSSVDYNNKLGMQRAEAVKAWLVSRGIDANRLTISTKGKSNPVIPNTTEPNRTYNRRVEFIIVK